MKITSWKPYPKNPAYLVSKTGQVVHILPSGERRDVLPRSDNKGYLRINVLSGERRSKEGSTYRRPFLHHVVLETWVGARPLGTECRHLDGNGENDALSNLAWGTPQENSQDRIRHGTQYRGERHHFSKLTAENVREIRSRTKTKLKFLAEEFGVSISTISVVLLNEVWKDA